MTIYSYVARTVDHGGWTGVCRFSASLKKIFPELREVTQLPELNSDDLVIADNHLSLEVPAENRKVIVFHGCAATHRHRDYAWQSAQTGSMVERQYWMLLNGIDGSNFPILVAPSKWVAERFCRDAAPDLIIEEWIKIIPHWVQSIPALAKSVKPIIIGDWRDNNKGSNT